MQQKHILMINLLMIGGLLGMAPMSDVEPTRGIGQYPGAQSEYFAPKVKWETVSELTNVAQWCAAYASSTVDYNHTAHLVTDGISGQEEPALLKVSTPDGVLPRREAEWTIDGGQFSRNVLMGAHTWIKYDWGQALSADIASVKVEGRVAYREGAKDYSIRCEVSEDGETWKTVGVLKGKDLPGTALHYRLHSDPNKQEAQEMIPARVLNETIRFNKPVCIKHFRLVLDMDEAVHWDIHELVFQDAGYQAVDVLPSTQFASMWISNGGGEQWIYTDLGRRLPIEQVVLDWYKAPRKGQIEVSDDARQWRKVANIGEAIKRKVNARYVRLLLKETDHVDYYALREMKVMAHWKKSYEPHAVAGNRADRYELTGGHWQLQRASEVKATGEEIASANYNSRGWVPATVPGTVLASFMDIGAVPDPNYADGVDQISESFFRSNFWYRDVFEVTDVQESLQQWLNFDGINWKANVFLNGQRIGRIEGAFKRGKFNVTGLLRKGRNYVAVEVICNDHFAAIKEKDKNSTQFNGGLLGSDNPTFHATVGWDWITTVRGREVGIWNEVYLTTSSAVTISDPYVQTELKGETVCVTPSVFLKNVSDHAVSGVLHGYIGNVKFEQVVTLAANSEQEVTFSSERFPQLTSKEFRLWWPNGYGEPYLYDAGFSFMESTLHYKAGLREMKYVGATDSLRIYVNGRRFIPKGGNWGFDEHNLLYRAREYDIAVGYHKDMNFTMIRNWVGQVGDEAFYEACDRHGVMVWQDFWLANPADGPNPYDERMFLENAEDYLRRIRSHASIGLYCGRNEGFPPESLDKQLRRYVHQWAKGVEYISHSSSQGVSGGGPYRALPMEEYFQRQSGKIHSERGMPNVMNIENLCRTFSQEGLWPQSLEWGQHDFTLQGAQRASTFNQMIETGFGQPRSAEEFSRWAQLINYNGYRVMFEATSRARAGLLLWMSHPCWPSMVWQTYDYYFEPTAAYFGAKKACEPLHIQYNALTERVEIVNHSAGNHKGIMATAMVFDLQGRLVAQQQRPFDSNEDSTQEWLKRTELLQTAITDVYFLRLQLSDQQGSVLSENTYIMGREEGNYKSLLQLPKANVEPSIELVGTTAMAVTLKNQGNTPAVFLRLNLKGKDGEQILPVWYSDNYVTLMPDEQKTIQVAWKLEDARGQKPMIEITAINE